MVAALLDCPTPTSPALAKYFYIRDVHIYATVKNMLGYEVDESILKPDDSILYDVPDSYKGKDFICRGEGWENIVIVFLGIMQ